MLFLFILFFSIIICTPLIGTIHEKFPDGYALIKLAIDKRVVAKLLSLILFTLLLIEGGLSIYRGSYIEYDAELASLVVSWLFDQGRPMYQTLEGPEVYSLLYGPLMYIPAALVFKFGGWLNEARIIGVSGVAVFLFASWKIIKHQQYRFEIFLWVLVSIYTTLYFVFCTQMNSWLIALPAVAVISALKGKMWPTAILAGIAFGIKITSVLYFLPLAIWLLTTNELKWKDILFSVVIFLFVIAAPFIVPGVSLDGFAFWIKAASLHKKISSQFWVNLSLFVTLSAPVALVLWRKRQSIASVKTEVITFGVTCFAGVVVSYLASKEGSGSYHLVPFMASFLLILQSRNDWDPTDASIVSMWLFAICAPIAFLLHSQFLTLTIYEHNFGEKAKTSDSVIAEMETYVKEKGDPSLFSIGPGKITNHRSNAIIHLLKLGGQYVLTDVTSTDWYASGIEIPEKTLTSFKKCSVRYWLIPAGDEPFVSVASYRKTELLFNKIVEIFPKYYYKEKSGKYFDLWACKANNANTR